MTEPRVWVFMPAGAQNGSSGRPQCAERLDLLDDKRAKQADDAGIGFGIELKGPSKAKDLGWTPEWINYAPYTIHMGNEDLSVLFAAEEEGNTAKIDAFWGVIEWLAELRPAPLSVGMHGARLNIPVVTLDEHRYDWRVPTGAFITLQNWHISLASAIRSRGVVPAIEIVSPSQFVGPPLYGPKWAPLTYAEARIGAHPVDLNFLKSFGCEAWVDFEHLDFAVNFFNRKQNYGWMADGKWANDAIYNDLIRRFGFAFEIGKPPAVREPIDYKLALESLRAVHYHVGGSQAEVVQIQHGESVPPDEYLEELRKMLEPYPGMFGEIRGKRVGSHDSIYRDDQVLRERLKIALALGGKTFLVETSGHTPTDCWYWAKPDALEFSYFELLAIMEEIL